MADDPQMQPYDTALKSLLEDHAAEMLPELLPESRFVEEQPTEVVRTRLLPDLVYLIDYRKRPHILNMELQTSTDVDMAYRMFLYHAGLFEKYELPVISMVVYPFKTTVPEPVFREEDGYEVLLEFRHRVLCLWTLDAAYYVQKRVVSMYTLLPAMKGANVALLLQAINEMRERYPEPHLARHLVRFRTILRRSTMLSEQDKQIVEDQLYTYDSLLELDPDFQARFTKGEIQGQQKTVLDFVEVRFPTLVEFAKQQIARLNQPEDLSRLAKMIAAAPDEAAARWALIMPPTANNT